MVVKCDTCKNRKFDVLGPDECGAGSTFSYCSKRHWDMECPDEQEYLMIKAGDDP